MPEALIDLRGYKKRFVNPHFYKVLDDKKSDLQVIVGGANSSKSYTVAQKLIYHTLTQKYSRYLACRKVKKDVKHSVYDQLREVLFNQKMEDLFTYNNTESNLTCKINGNDILGVGLDDVNKLKSFTNPTGFWMEEADQATPDDIEQLSLRLRGPEGLCFLQGILSFNPISAQHWIKLKYFDHKIESVLLHHSTYKDNIFLSPDVIRRMESITDPYYVRVYVNGEWGIFSNGVFNNYIIEEFDYTENDLENVFYGMDFGYEHAQVIECAGFKDGELYVFNELYAKHRTNAQFIEDAKEYFGDKLFSMYIIADSANPDKIKEWNDYNFRVEPAKKGKDSVRYGVEFLTGLKIHIHESRCSNLAKEIQLFKRREDKDGNVTEDFVEVNDDGIAALRYGSEFIWNNRNAVWYDPGYSLSELGL